MQLFGQLNNQGVNIFLISPSLLFWGKLSVKGAGFRGQNEKKNWQNVLFLLVGPAVFAEVCFLVALHILYIFSSSFRWSSSIGAGVIFSAQVCLGISAALICHEKIIVLRYISGQTECGIGCFFYFLKALILGVMVEFA